MDAILVRDVHKCFASVPALRGLSLAVSENSFFGLLGPNGAGKSTLIGILAGLVRADSGEVRVCGHEVVRDYRRARASLGLVPQELVYDPFFTVRELLRLQAGYFGLGRRARPWIDELLALLALEDKADANMHQLSGGMKRRVLIAQALVHRPPVVVLDEPTAGVDVELRQALWALTRRLHAEGHTLILTTHYLEEAEALCERIAIINRGRLVALDDKDALLARHPYRLLCLTLDREPPSLPDPLRARLVERGDCQFTFRLDRHGDPVGAILDQVRALGVEIVDLHLEEPSLEEIFVHLTRESA